MKKNQEFEHLECDVLIIGGGINGCGIAADAASRGLNVILCEQNDLASATSSASSKLIHGGLRYLEQYEFNMVRKSLKEREILSKNCPYLVKPLAFILPFYRHMRNFYLVRLGLFIYDHLAKTTFPKTMSVNKTRNPKYFSNLKPNISKALKYFDAQTIDSRLTIINALQAKKHGATILTNTKLKSAHREINTWQADLEANNINYKVNTKLLINATGPWAKQVSDNLNIKHSYKLSLVQGCHIVIPKIYDGDFAYILQNDDDRIVFTIPYHNDFTLIGTTEVKVSDLDNKSKLTKGELDYLLNLIHKYFVITISENDIIHTYVGVRPLVKDNKVINTKNISRDYQIIKDDLAAPFITILGGKLTTYRVLAKECIDLCTKYFPSLRDCRTHNLPLPGSNYTNFKVLLKNIEKKFSFLNNKQITRYASLYGSRAFEILANCKNIHDLGIYFGGQLYQQEVDFLIKNEWARNGSDILWRRTKEGLYFNNKQTKVLEKYLSNRTFELIA